MTKTHICFVATAIFYAAVLLASCGTQKKAEAVLNDAVLVQTHLAEKKPYNEELISFGAISFKTKNDITALVEGTIIELAVKEGDFVMRGQQLARLRNVQLELQKEQAENSLESGRAALNVAETRLWETTLGIESRLLALEKMNIMISQKELELEKAATDLDNSKTLLEVGGITESNHKSMELAYKSAETELAIMKKEREVSRLGLTADDLIANGITPAHDAESFRRQIIDVNIRGIQAEIAAAKSNLKNVENNLSSVNMLLGELTLRAPAAGIVGARYYENGEFVKQNEKVFTLIDIAEVYAVFYIQEQDIINFEIGSPLELDVPSLGKKIAAKIDEISPMADAQSGNFSVKAIVLNADAKIKPGMFVKCAIPKNANRPSFVAFPESALSNRVQGAAGNALSGTVFCAVNNIAVQKNVEIFAQKDGTIWLKSGIAEGDAVIDKPSPFLKEGMNVAHK